MHTQPQRLIIVGGGVIGLSTAYYALKEGFQVTVLERLLETDDNCSIGNAGMIVPSHFTPLAAPGMLSKGLRWMMNPESPFYVRPRPSLELAHWGWLFCQHATTAHVMAVRQMICELNLESRRLFEELSQEGDFGLCTRGLLMLCETQHGLDEEAEVATQARSLGLQADVLDAAATAKLDPSITMNITGAVHFVQDAHLDPARFMAVLRQRIQAMGGEIRYDCPIDTIETGSGKTIAVSGLQGRFTADHFVIAAGSWTRGLARQIRLNLPLQPGKGYSLTLPTPPQLPQLCSIFAEAKVAITPMGSSLRFAGTMEIGGLNHDINPRRIRGITKAVERYFPAFSEVDFKGIDPWVGLRPVSPDGVPYLGTAPGLKNLVVATGHAMMGLSLGPVTGKIATGLLMGQKPLPQLDVARFS